jgi:hypothetical protein
MPIQPDLRSKFYGADWRRYVQTLIAITGRRCSICGACNFRLSGMHRTHDPRDMALVAIACVSCHTRFDSGHRVAVMRRSRAKKVGQLWLLPEIEFAAVPAWLIPRRVIAELQEKLF